MKKLFVLCLLIGASILNANADPIVDILTNNLSDKGIVSYTVSSATNNNICFDTFLPPGGLLPSGKPVTSTVIVNYKKCTGNGDGPFGIDAFYIYKFYYTPPGSKSSYYIGSVVADINKYLNDKTWTVNNFNSWLSISTPRRLYTLGSSVEITLSGSPP